MKDRVNDEGRWLRSPGNFGSRRLDRAAGGRRPSLFPGRGFPVVSALWLLFFSGPRGAFAGVFLSIGEEAGNFYSGEIAELTLTITGISPEETAAAWKLLLGEAVVGEGQAPGVGARDGAAWMRTRLAFPEVTRPVRVDWAVGVFAGVEPVAQAVFPFRVYPRDLGDRLRAVLSPRKPGVFDPGGRLVGLLSALGVEFADLRTDLALRAFRGETLLVGPGAFSSPRDRFFALLEETGVRSVLVLDQDVFPDDLPLRLELGAPLPPPGSASIPAAPGHPALPGLGGEVLPAAGPGVCPLKKPARGRYRSLIDPESGSPAGGEALSLALEYLPGRPRIIFCQLPLVEAAGRDPAADLLLASLARALLLPGEDPEPVLVIGGPGREEEEFCRELGLPAPRLALPAAGHRRVIVFAGRSTASALSEKGDDLPGALAALAEGGGRVALIGLEPETLSLWRPLLPEGLELEDYAPGEFGPSADPLFWGITEAEWDECLRLAEAAGVFLYRVRGEELRPVASPLVWKAERGRGAVVVCQYPFHRLFGEPPVSAAAAQFFTNFSLARSPGPAGIEEGAR